MRALRLPLVQLAILMALAALLLPAIGPARVVGHGAGIKILFLARMAALLVLATLLLRLLVLAGPMSACPIRAGGASRSASASASPASRSA